MKSIAYRRKKKLPQEQVLLLYSSVGWSAAHKPAELLKALANSHTVISAWDGERLVGLGNAISDGYLVVYYPHLVVLPDYQGRGIGREIVRRMQAKYGKFHQQSLLADHRATEFYKKCGFHQAGKCKPLWIYDGQDHG